MAVATGSDEVALRRRPLPIACPFQRFNSAVAGGRDRGVPPLPSFRKSSITDSFVVGNDLKPSTPKSPGLCQELDSIRCIGRLRLWSLRIVQQCGISVRQLRRDLANIGTDIQVLAQSGSIAIYATNAADSQFPFGSLCLRTCDCFSWAATMFQSRQSSKQLATSLVRLNQGWNGLDIAARFSLEDIATATRVG